MDMPPATVRRLRRPWLYHTDGTLLRVRGARPLDLSAAALMHTRCSAKTRLDRYRAGGRGPAREVLDRQLRDPLSYVVEAEDGRVVALGRVAPDLGHARGSAEIAVLVEDEFQARGIGTALVRHLSAAASLAGFVQLISYPGTTPATVRRMMAAIGSTRSLHTPEWHLHTTLPATARVGLGDLGGAERVPGAAGQAAATPVVDQQTELAAITALAVS